MIALGKVLSSRCYRALTIARCDLRLPGGLRTTLGLGPTSARRGPSTLLATDGVGDCHDLHVWTITSTMNVLSVHVTLQDGADGPQVLDRLGNCLADHFDIEHSTFQLEPHIWRTRDHSTSSSWGRRPAA